MQKVWNIKKYDEELVEKVKETYNVSTMLAKLMISRGVEFEEMGSFLRADLSKIEDPFVMKDMDKFVKRVDKAISEKEKICIYGDYDVDGITSITVLYKFLKGLGAEVSYYLPDRLIEGYGVNKEAIDEIIEKYGSKLIITVDCGITATEEVKYAKTKGVDFLITDHHECLEKAPKAFGVIDAKQKDDKSKFKELAGVGVAFKCIMALAKHFGLDESSYMKYIDLVAIGTISDIVSLTSENRIISKYGLEAMKVSKNVGLSSLLKLVGSNEIDSSLVSFSLAPRINACGRMGNASLAVELFLSEKMPEATRLAEKLDSYNKQRQEIEKKIYEKALKIATEKGLVVKKSIVLYDEKWHSGIIGIVASKLSSMFYKPVILFTKENGVVRGSGRCPAGFSLYSAVSKCSDLLIQFGGHEHAAGMTIEEENIEKFAERFEEVAANSIPKDSREVLDIDMEIDKNDLNVRTVKDVFLIKPYGQLNPEPVFAYKNLRVQAISTIKDGKHLKLTLRDQNNLILAIGFSIGDRRDELVIGDKVDIVANIAINTYTSPKTIQFMIKDFRKVI
ncbi:MAG: single-stranded-DNA-specific exonuclease RecJ [Clostridia bacterium]|nr:single-stranded-DNA-specific exonuclease RecJ [Clostridia bacterium]